MSDRTHQIVQKLWSYCNVLRDDGLSYQDYLEQLTTLLFLKMAEERAGLRGEEQPIPKGRRWSVLHAAGADRGDGRLHRAKAGRADLRPGLRHGRLPHRGP